MSLRFSLLAGAALVLSPLASAQSLTTHDGPITPYINAESFSGGITLTQNLDTQTVDFAGVACGNNDEGYTTENSYWRVFDLAALSLGGGLDVLSAQVGLRSADFGDPLEGAFVNLYTLPAGTDVSTFFSAADLTLVAESPLFDVDALGGALYIETVEFDMASVPEDALLAVEMFTPTGQSEDPEANPNRNVRFGGNLNGEEAPTYLSSASCGIADPTATGAIGGGFDGGWVLVLEGTVATASEDGITTRSVSIGTPQPNPVADAAKVPFTLEASVAVRASVYDLLGREVAELADRAYAAGDHELSLDAAELPAGTYVVRLEAGAESVTQMVTVVR